MIDTTTKGFTLVRNLDATPAEIWEGWTNPDETARCRRVRRLGQRAGRTG
jgi:uncharacterized protein YndB with AHSA1/START domain